MQIGTWGGSHSRVETPPQEVTWNIQMISRDQLVDQSAHDMAGSGRADDLTGSPAARSDEVSRDELECRARPSNEPLPTHSAAASASDRDSRARGLTELVSAMSGAVWP